MTNLPPNDRPPTKRPDWLDDQAYARLKAEAAAPYRGLRRFMYVAFAGSGAIGGFIFLTQLLAGRGESDTLPNLALQAGVVALMIWLLRLENKAERNQQNKP